MAAKKKQIIRTFTDKIDMFPDGKLNQYLEAHPEYYISFFTTTIHEGKIISRYLFIIMEEN
jgi:hypothetical protein